MRHAFDPELAIADMAAAWKSSIADPSLLARMDRFCVERHAWIVELRMLLLSTCADWIEAAKVSGEDREVIDRVAANELQFAASLVLAGMKKRSGAQFSPARVALVAYEIATRVAALPNDEPTEVPE